jgi:ABC-type transporter Mla subunit MlaD
MTESSFNPIRPVQPVDPVTTGKQKVDAAKPRGAAFEALLERLETQARDLEQKSQTVTGASDLADAVGRAQETLASALSFSDSVLEAFRQKVQQASAGDAVDASKPGQPSEAPGTSGPGGIASR